MSSSCQVDLGRRRSSRAHPRPWSLICSILPVIGFTRRQSAAGSPIMSTLADCRSTRARIKSTICCSARSKVTASPCHWAAESDRSVFAIKAARTSSGSTPEANQLPTMRRGSPRTRGSPGRYRRRCQRSPRPGAAVSCGTKRCENRVRASASSISPRIHSSSLVKSSGLPIASSCWAAETMSMAPGPAKFEVRSSRNAVGPAKPLRAPPSLEGARVGVGIQQVVGGVAE